MADRWNPWADLRRRDHLVFALVPLPGRLRGAYVADGDLAAVLIDSALPRRVRKAVLAHELVHDERGGGVDHPEMPAGWAAVAAREEHAVNREVARRLVPEADLLAWLERCEAKEWGVTIDQVAEEFDVSDEVAAEALRRLESDR